MMLDVLIQFAESWWPLYAVHMLETSLFILLVWAVDRWVNLDTRLRYALWLCALVKAFVPPFYALPLPAFLFDAPAPVAPVVSQPMPVWEPVPFELAPVVLPPEPIPIAFWIFTVWSFSVLGFVGLTLWRNRVFQSALGIANRVELSADLADLTQGANLKVFSKANLNSPLLVGVVKPRLYLPSSWQTWTPTQLRGVVAHELAHYHNRDLWALAFQVLATIFFGLNPLCWLVNRRLAHLRELRCDEDALKKSGISPVEYSKLLYAFLDAKAHPGLPALGFTEKDTPLKKRFEHVLNFKGGTMKRSKWQLAVPVLVALAIVPFSIRETYSQPQDVLHPQIDNLRRELESQGTYGMMFRKRQVDIKRLLVRVTAPEYPKDLLKQGVEGNIEMALVVDGDGQVVQVTRMGGDARFEKAAVDALRQARFRASENGASTTLKQTILFRVKDGKALVVELPETFWQNSDMGEMIVWAKATDTQAGEANARIKPTKQIPPIYPEHLRTSGVEGYVLMDVTINASGRVDGVRLLEGDAQFEPAAQVALKQFRFTPFSHAPSINRTQIMVFRLASDKGHLYDPSEEVMKKSDFGPMVVIAKGPNNGTGVRPDLQENGYTFQVGFSPRGEPHVYIGMQVKVVGMTSSDQDILREQNNVVLKSVVEIVTKSERDVFFEEGTRFQLRQDIRSVLQKKLSVRVKDVLLEGITARTEISDIWVNYKGDIVINMNRPVSVEDLDVEFQELKNSGKIQSLSLRVDRSAPQNVVDAIQQSAVRAGLNVKDNTPSLESRQGNRVNYPQEKSASVLYASVNPEGYVRLNTGNAYQGTELLEALRQFKTNGAQEIKISENGNAPQNAVTALKGYARQVGLNVVVDTEPIIHFYKVDKKPKIRNTVKPVYPANARGQKEKVFVKFLINADGSVSHVSVLRGDQVFHQAAIDAVKQLQYQPAEHQGKKVAVWMTRPIMFDPKASAEEPLKDLRQIYASHEVDVKPHPLEIPSPKYPPEAKAQGLSGKVFVTGVVNVDGTVSDVRILRGDEAFYETALNTVKQMKFRSGKHQGKIVPVRMIFPMDFGMKKSGERSSSMEAKLTGQGQSEDIAHIWVNTKGQVLVDFSKQVSLESLGDELARLKREKNIQIIRVQPDEDTPMGFVQKALDAVGKAGLKAEMFKRGGVIIEVKKPLDLNNLEFYQVDDRPEPVEQVKPVYPEIADRIGLTGKVFLKFRVNEDGSVGEVEVLRGQQVFRDAAIEAIEKFRFRPAELEGKPVAVWMTQPISFRHGRGPLVEQQVDLNAFTTDVPNGQGDMGKAHAQFILTVISKGAAEVIEENQQKAQQSARAYVSQIPLDQWATEEQQLAIMNGVKEQLNSTFGVPLVKDVAIAKLLVNPTEHIAQNHAFKLHSNFPNPFNPQTSIKYEVAEPIFVRMEIYNITGQVIRTLVAKDHTPGQYETRWDGTNDQGNPVASGVYYYHINAGSFNAVKKMQLVK